MTHLSRCLVIIRWSQRRRGKEGAIFKVPHSGHPLGIKFLCPRGATDAVIGPLC
jgi:hypothetical protein